MKFQNCILINFVTDGRTDGRAQSYAPSTFPKLGASKDCIHISPDIWLIVFYHMMSRLGVV